MTKKSKIVLTSCMTIALSASLIAGSTFALFSSQSDTSIVVTAGKVKVDAKVGEPSLYTNLYGTKTSMQDKTWTNGGTLTVDAGKMTVENITPGDGFTFELKITNYSTVNTKWQLQVASEGNFLDYLQIDMAQSEGETIELIDTGSARLSKWMPLEAATKEEGDTIATYTVTVELPETVDDKIVNGDESKSIQGKEFGLDITVVAYQSNVQTYDPVVANPDWNGETIASVADLMAFRDKVNTGDNFANQTITLTKDLDLGGIDNWEPIGTSTTPFRGTFEGGNNTISNMTVNLPEQNYVGLFAHLNGVVNNVTIKNANVKGKEDVAVVAGTIFNYGTISNVTVENAEISGNHYVGGVAGYAYGNVTGCKVDGLELTCTPNLEGEKYDNGDKVGGIVGYVGEGGYTVTQNTVSNSTITAYRDLAGIAGYSNVIATYNTVKNVTLVVDRTLADSYVSVKPVNLVDYITSNGKHDDTNTATDATIKYIGVDSYVDVAGAYHVYTAAGLRAFGEKASSARGEALVVVLENDIDLNDGATPGESNWTPIATPWGETPPVPQGVIIDGNGFTIANMTIIDSRAGGIGFFSTWQSGAYVIKDLTFKNPHLEGGNSRGVIVGQLQGGAGLTIDNVTIDGANIKGGIRLGALIGQVTGEYGDRAEETLTIRNCKVKNTIITGTYHNVGGLIGSYDLALTGNTKLEVSGCSVTDCTFVLSEGSAQIHRVNPFVHDNIEQYGSYALNEQLRVLNEKIARFATANTQSGNTLIVAGQTLKDNGSNTFSIVTD